MVIFFQTNMPISFSINLQEFIVILFLSINFALFFFYFLPSYFALFYAVTYCEQWGTDCYTLYLARNELVHCVAESDLRHAQHPLKMLGIDFSCGWYQTTSELIIFFK